MVATLKKQKKNTKDEFDERAKAVIVEFAQQVSGPRQPEDSRPHSVYPVFTSSASCFSTRV